MQWRSSNVPSLQSAQKHTCMVTVSLVLITVTFLYFCISLNAHSFSVQHIVPSRSLPIVHCIAQTFEVCHSFTRKMVSHDIHITNTAHYWSCSHTVSLLNSLICRPSSPYYGLMSGFHSGDKSTALLDDVNWQKFTDASGETCCFHCLG